MLKQRIKIKIKEQESEVKERNPRGDTTRQRQFPGDSILTGVFRERMQRCLSVWQRPFSV